MQRHFLFWDWQHMSEGAEKRRTLWAELQRTLRRQHIARLSQEPPAPARSCSAARNHLRSCSEQRANAYQKRLPWPPLTETFLSARWQLFRSLDAQLWVGRDNPPRQVVSSAGAGARCGSAVPAAGWHSCATERVAA